MLTDTRLRHLKPKEKLYKVNDRDGLYVKWFTEFGLLNRGDMLTSEHYRCLNEKKKFQRRV